MRRLERPGALCGVWGFENCLSVGLVDSGVGVEEFGLWGLGLRAYSAFED